MLYDPNWKKEVECKPSLEGFIAFLETKDPNEKYMYVDSGTCAVAQYLTHINYPGRRRLPNSEAINEVFGGLDVGDVVNHGIVMTQTFGEALRKARALQEASTR